MTHHLTRDQARRIVVRAQLLDADRPGDVVEVAEQLGAIKIDPTATIAPAEHTILWSRIGCVLRAGAAHEGSRDRPAAVRVRRSVPSDQPAAAHAAGDAALAAA